MTGGGRVFHYSIYRGSVRRWGQEVAVYPILWGLCEESGEGGGGCVPHYCMYGGSMRGLGQEVVAY